MKEFLFDHVSTGVERSSADATTSMYPRLEATVRWIAARARRCCVLVGDSLGRISLEVREGLAPEVARREERALGRRSVAEPEAIFRHYTTEEVSFEIRRVPARGDRLVRVPRRGRLAGAGLSRIHRLHHRRRGRPTPSLPAPLRALGFISLWLDAKNGAR